MPNQASDVYNYLQRPVLVQDTRKVNLEFRQHFGNVTRIVVNSENFYTLPSDDEQAQDMGRSEKLILYSENAMLEAIENTTTPKPDALLKLPKHGSIKQVQNETMALGIAECAYGLTTALATMVNFEGKPAIFVPFDDMTPLTKVAAGESRVRNDGKVAHENSTLNPIGSGLSPNVFIEDFGNAFGLMYLSGDPDAVGLENQNKGYIGNRLYVFDQAISTYAERPYFDLFKVDSRLCQTPSTPLTKRIRHTKGRNFSLLEDASTANKFASMSIENCKRVVNYCDEVINGYKHQTYESIKDYNQGQYLMQGAIEVREAIIARINKYQRMLPTATNVDNETLKNTLILEKLLNKPKLYTDLGRPYRNLTTTTPHKLRIINVTGQENDLVNIEFKNKLSSETIKVLQDKLGSNNLVISPNRRSITLDRNLLNDLETTFYPEIASEVGSGDYFSQKDIENICATYNDESQSYTTFVNQYANAMQHASSPEVEICILNTFRKNLKNHESQESNPGLHKHLSKKFEYNIQQKLQEILENRLLQQFSDEDVSSFIQTQNQAFASAVKLDCLAEFNSLCIQYAKHPNNTQLAESIRSIFTDFSALDETALTIDDATELREDFLSRMQNALSSELNYRQQKDNQEFYKNEIKNMTGRNNPADTLEKDDNNAENIPHRPSNL